MGSLCCQLKLKRTIVSGNVAVAGFDVPTLLTVVPACFHPIATVFTPHKPNLNKTLSALFIHATHHFHLPFSLDVVTVLRKSNTTRTAGEQRTLCFTAQPSLCNVF